MNKTHRIVCSESCQPTIVAHEKSAFGGRPSTTIALSFALLLGVSAQAAPGANELLTGGNIVGNATISTNGGRMDVLEATQHTAINWDTFNIGSAAHVHFQPPSGEGLGMRRFTPLASQPGLLLSEHNQRTLIGISVRTLLRSFSISNS